MTDDDEEDGGDKYVLTNGEKPCDECAGMAGEYDFEPTVPLHDKCACKVLKKGSGTGCDHPTYQIRDLQVEEDEYTEDIVALEFDNPGEPRETTVEVEYGIEMAEFDEGVAEELNWSPIGGSGSSTFMLPAHSAGEVIAEVLFQQITCVGEKWEICEEEDPIAGFRHSERYVGDVGGIGIAVAGLVSVRINTEPSHSGAFGDDDKAPV